MKIAIDGPAGSGKSTVAKIISKTLSLPYLDTGSVYRAFGYMAKEKGINLEQAQEVLSLFEDPPLVKIGIAITEVFYKGKKLDRELRSEEVGRYASLVGSVPAFRERMITFFRELVGDAQVVAEGRDTGTHIFPDAPVKVFITASLEERARRRHKDMPDGTSYQEVLLALAERDKRDMERPLYPFRPAEDAIVIDTTYMTVEDVVEKVLKIIKEKAPHLRV